MPLLLLLALLLVAAQAAAQPAGFAEDVLRGVVWTPPEDGARALDELRAMRAYGVEAVRMPATLDAALLSAADGLGLSLFLDLPFERLAAPLLLDTLGYAGRYVDRLVVLAGRHPSIRALGLAAAVDTSVPEACAYFEALAPRARDAGLIPYYRTRFIEYDRCSAAVDLVLLRARGRDPVPVLARWRAHHQTAAGIGALGAEVREGLSGGHLTTGTPAAQARFLETSLRELMTLRPVPPAVFVHQWRDPAYGLHAADGTPRPAASVVAGFYTGRQTVFAIDAGPEPSAPPGATSFMVLGWLTALILIALMSIAPRMRELVPRYFGKHNYYREAVQRSASLEGYGAFGLAIAVAVSAGVVFGVVLHTMAKTEIIEVALNNLGDFELALVVDTLRRPLITVVIGGLLYGLWLMLNIVWLRILAGRRYRIRPLQATLLAVMSRWQVVVLGVLALLAAQAADPLAWLPWLLGGWALVELYALVRMLYDYSKVTRVPMQHAILTGLGGALAVIAAVVVSALLWAGPQLTFLWHLATRT